MTPDEAFDFRFGRKRRPVTRLRDIELSEVSCVDVPANSGARHLMFKNAIADTSPAPLPVPQAVLDPLVNAAVAKAVARIEASLARTDAIAARMDAQPVAKGADAVAEALGAAAAREERPEAYWRTALAELARSIAPDAGPAERMGLVLADPRGKLLVQALTGDFRDLRG
jgi:hypothetical protein